MCCSIRCIEMSLALHSYMSERERGRVHSAKVAAEQKQDMREGEQSKLLVESVITLRRE